MSIRDIRERLRSLQALDLPVNEGRTLAYVYDSGREDAVALGREALAMFGDTNGLDPTGFPSLLVMENDLVAMAGELMSAPEGFAGAATSGGTESILLAVLAARDSRPEVERPTMVLPSTAHAAFHKAAHLFGVEAVVVDVDADSKRACPEAMAAAVDDRTVLVVASAPSFAYGVVDPVPSIAAIAAERGVRCHVDACIGGWVLPFLEGGVDWDFAVPGVTSISVDLHKYGYSPKGISLLLHRSVQERRHHYFAWSDWPGYSIVNPTLQSTKSGGPVAAAWAVTRHIGREGYAALAREARAAVLELVRRIEQIPGLSVVTPPDSTLLAMVADESCDVFTIADEMLERGWFVQPQMGFRGEPPTIHITVSAATAPLVDSFISSFTASVRAAQEAGPIVIPAEMAALAASLTPAALTPEVMGALMAFSGVSNGTRGVALPDRMGPVNALLNVLPPAVRNEILVEFMGLLATPSA